MQALDGEPERATVAGMKSRSAMLWGRTLIPVGLMILAGCSKSVEESLETEPGPYVLVLGTAQDGGLPQIGCHRACCVHARENPASARRVTLSLIHI